MDDTNGSYFFCFLLFHLILPLPHLFMSCFIPYVPLPLKLSLFSLSPLTPPPSIPLSPSHNSSSHILSLPLSLSLHLSLLHPQSHSSLPQFLLTHPLPPSLSLFHLSLLHPQSHSLPPSTIPPHTSSPSLSLSLFHPLTPPPSIPLSPSHNSSSHILSLPLSLSLSPLTPPPSIPLSPSHNSSSHILSLPLSLSLSPLTPPPSIPLSPSHNSSSHISPSLPLSPSLLSLYLYSSPSIPTLSPPPPHTSSPPLSSLFHLSLLHLNPTLPPTIPPHTSCPSLSLPPSLSLSLCSGAAQPVGSSRAPAALHRARSGTQRQLPGSPVCGHPPAPWREGTDIPHTCSQTLAIWREESWVERPRERKSMQMAWFTSTCSFSVSENRNVVSDILYILYVRPNVSYIGIYRLTL